MRLSALPFLAVLVCAAPQSGAAGTVFHQDLADAAARLQRARGPEAITALRRVWQTWDRADPGHVEEVLLAGEREGATPAVRAYAGTLAAYARSRRGDLEAASAKIKKLGYVDRWLVVGPFDNEGKAGFETEFEPELDFAKPITPGQAYSGKERPVRWRNAPLAFPFGWLDFGALVRPEQKVCAYATTYVQKTKGAPQITAWVGSTGAFKLFFNGAEVLSDKVYRAQDADRFAAALTLRPGFNNLTAKVCSDDTAPVLSLRLGDAAGAPDPNIETRADLALSEQAARHVVPKSAAAKAATGATEAATQKAPVGAAAKTPPEKPTAKAARAKGPAGAVQLFEQLLADGETPAEQQAYAEYLQITRGDDPTVHRARDLAIKAAEAEPTLERLLLASELAEDRNRRAEWLERAKALAAKQPRPTVELLLALAAHARGGPNPREAFPFYDRVLTSDPDNVIALRGRAELYNEAGLGRTALGVIEEAVARNPDSVYLLNMYATQLRGLGRSREADEAESRYFGLRFDDRTFLNERLELAVTRRDTRAAERWIERLLQVDPDSQWALAAAARAYRALGQQERAIATYQRALELAPEDVGSLRLLSDLYGELGKRDEQLRTLQKVLTLRPQDKDVREYVRHIEPERPRADEAYAWQPERFLPLRAAPAGGQNSRILRDLQVSTVYRNGLASRFRQLVFQPLTDAAAASARNYAFQYEADRQIVQLRGARVYRSNGRVDEAIESGEGAANDPSIAMYTSSRNFYVQFPRLEAGDVVELRYRIDETVSQNAFADYFGEVAYLQSGEPVANAEYVLVTPKDRTFYIDTNLNGLTREVKESADTRTYRFFAKRIAPLSPEPAMPPWPEVLGFIHVSTYKSWADLGRWYWGLAREQFDLDEETRRLARSVAKDAKTDLEKVKAVYDWVVKNTRYVALEFGIYGYKPRRCVQTVARGWGDCKDKATVIVTLLKELGVPATIVILRTQLRGDFKSQVASLAAFDHAIAYVPSLGLYLDGTAEHTGAFELPKADLGALGLLVNEGKSQITRLPLADPERNVQRRTVSALLSKTGEAKIEVSFDTQGASAPEWRRAYHAEGTRRERLSANLASEFPGFVIADGPGAITTTNLDDYEQPVQITVKGSAPVFARREGDGLSVAATTDLRLTPQFASLSQRRQDVVLLGLPSVDDTFILKLPPGMKLRGGPASSSGESPFGYYRVHVEEKPGQVTVRSRVTIKVNRVRPAEYPAWKKFCADVDRALSPRVVIGP